MKLNDPFTKEELKASVYLMKQNLANVFEKIDEKIFFQVPNQGWSPAENVQHINKVTKLLTLSYSTPKFIASLIFGEGDSNSRRMQSVGDVYLDALSKGQNSGPFAPSKEKIDGNTAKRKTELLLEWNQAWDKYALALEDWNEEQLDKIRMPHPFLGKITAREMYMVGMLHPIHHCNIVSKRLNQEWSYF
jgi:hypothetical protein